MQRNSQKDLFYAIFFTSVKPFLYIVGSWIFKIIYRPSYTASHGFRDRQTDNQKNILTKGQIYRMIDRQKDRQTDRQKNIQTKEQAHIRTGRQKNILTKGQTYRSTYKQADRQKN